MFKLRQMILMLCLILSGALCYANGEVKLEKKGDGTPIEIIEKACHFLIYLTKVNFRLIVTLC